MKLFPTPSPVASNQYGAYVKNCQRGPCELPFTGPIPSIPELQVYIDFGGYPPALIELTLQDTCNPDHTEQLFASNYIVGQTPEGNYYGVFKYFSSPLVPVTNFVVWADVYLDTPGGPVNVTYFSEMLTVEPCAPLLKVKACQPENATTTGFDINGVYYGLPVNMDYLGQDGVRYFHIAWVRFGKVREVSNKATFTASLVRNFRTTVEKIWLLESELVPQWYKDELLAIYARGAINVSGKNWLVSDLAIEALNDDDFIWKPFAQLKETFNLYFGCDESQCVECCSPVVISAQTITLGESDSEIGPP